MTFVDETKHRLVTVARSIPAEDLSALVLINEVGAKYLLVSAAGDLEQRTIDAVIYLYEHDQTSAHLRHFVRHKALERQFHTLFDWRNKKPNTFFSLFGPEKKKELVELCAGDQYKQCTDDFLSIVHYRNEMVHTGLAAYSLPLTLEDVYAMYRSALGFVNLIRIGIR